MFTKSTIKPCSKVNLVQFYKLILIMLIICGYDFNVWKLRLGLKIFIPVFCISLVILNVYANFACCTGQLLSTIWSVIEYTASVILTLILKNKSANYFQKLSEIDPYLRIGPKYYLSMRNKTLWCTIFLWVVRVIYTILYSIWFPYYYEDLTLYVISQFSLMALDLSRVWRFILFDMTRYRLKMLRCRIKEMKNHDFYCYVSNHKTLKQTRILFCLQLYRSIADALDYILPELTASLIISIVCTIPKIILNAYHILLYIENEEPMASLGFAALHVTQVTLFIFAPCLVVELYGVEVERIQLLLVHKLFDQPDESTKTEVDLFLRYIKLRPFRLYLWRILPITIALPLDLINLCTNYIIVLINFSHLYDA